MNFIARLKKIQNALSATEFQTSRQVASKTGLSVQRVCHILTSLEHQYVVKRRKRIRVQLSSGRIVTREVYEWKKNSVTGVLTMQKHIGNLETNRKMIWERAEGENRTVSLPEARTDRPSSTRKMGESRMTSLFCSSCGNKERFHSEVSGSYNGVPIRTVYCKQCGVSVATEECSLSIEDLKYGRGPEHGTVWDKNLGSSRANRNKILTLAVNEAKKYGLPGCYVPRSDYKTHIQRFWKLKDWDKPIDDRNMRLALEILSSEIKAVETQNHRKLSESEASRLGISIRKAIRQRTQLSKREVKDMVETVLKLEGLKI